MTDTLAADVERRLRDDIRRYQREAHELALKLERAEARHQRELAAAYAVSDQHQARVTTLESELLRCDPDRTTALENRHRALIRELRADLDIPARRT